MVKFSISMSTHLRADKCRQDGMQPITHFLSFDKVQRKISTGKYLHPADWDKAKQRPKTHTKYGKALERYLSQIKVDFDTYMLAKEREGPITLTIALAFFNRENDMTLFSYWDQQIELMTKQGMADATLKSYGTTRQALKDFNPNMNFYDLNLPTLKKFDAWLVTVRNNSKNGKWVKHKNLKAMLTRALAEEYIKVNPYDRFKMEKEDVQRQFLTIDEVKQLQSFELNPDLWMLHQVRDLFLFSCHTGLRFSDVINLKVGDLKTDKGHNRLEIVVTKSKRKLIVPLSSNALRIIKYYIKDITKPADKIFPQIANQVVNRNLKELAKMVGLDKHISYHCSRHSYAVTNVEAGTDLIFLRDLMGHKDIKQTQIYAKVTEAHLYKTVEQFEKVFESR